MDRELRILILEDSLKDAELLQRELRKGGVSFTARRAEAQDAFLDQLEEFQPDLILSDYKLPSFDGVTALGIVRQRSSEIPFILVSGSIGEERATEALKLGATDYLLKDRLSRLVPAVRRAMREVEEHEEHRKVEEQLQQTQKMEAIGQLAGGVAHDFNNLLTAILGYSEIIMGQLSKDDPLQSELAEIHKAGKRASDLTRQLLAFSRRQLLVPKVLDLNAIVADMAKMLRRVIGEHIEVRHKPQADLGRVKADPSQIEQVILNLAVNARDAMPKGGRLTIETQDIELDEEYALTHPECSAGSYVMLAVSDTGIGMDRETQARIFEPFFTTKERGRGTGLGLATVFGIVKQSKGHIWVYSEPHRGSTFKVYFPRVEEPAQPYKSGVYKALPKGGTETILVVEDDDSVRNLTCNVLKSHGYRVIAAKNASEAIASQQASTMPVQLMITDAVMPGMSGGQLAHQMKAADPRMKILHMSGYTEGAIVNQGELTEGTPFLPKPFTPETLLRTVREVLDATPG